MLIMDLSGHNHGWGTELELLYVLHQGNLCWEAALEFTLSSRSVHAPVMDPNNKVMDPEGKQRCTAISK